MPLLRYLHPHLLQVGDWSSRVNQQLRDQYQKVLAFVHQLVQSDVNPYCLKAIEWKYGKGDIVRDFVNSCRKYDVKPGIYLGIRWNSFF